MRRATALPAVPAAASHLMSSSINGLINGPMNGRHLPPPIMIAQQAGRLAPLSVVAHNAGASPIRSPNAGSNPSLPSPPSASQHHHHPPPPGPPPPRLYEYESREPREIHEPDPARREYLDEADDNGEADGDGDSSSRPRKKQKRNKPTLSCHECVDRKTKVSPC